MCLADLKHIHIETIHRRFRVPSRARLVRATPTTIGSTRGNAKMVKYFRQKKY